MKRIVILALVCVLVSFQYGWGACNQQFEECSFDILDVVGGVLSVPCKLLSACLGLAWAADDRVPIGRITSVPKKKMAPKKRSVPRKRTVSKKPPKESPPKITRKAPTREQPEPPPITREPEPDPTPQAKTVPREEPPQIAPPASEPEETVEPRKTKKRLRKAPCGPYYVPRPRRPCFHCR